MFFIMKREHQLFIKNFAAITLIALFLLMAAFQGRPHEIAARGFDPSLLSDTSVLDTTPVFEKEEIIDSIIALGKTFMGLRYRYGGRTPAGFDCSGYVSYLFSQFGYKLPTSSSAMINVGDEIPYEESRKGDLILFKGRNAKSPAVGHVAIIIGVDTSGVEMLHSNHRGVTIDRYPQMDYYRPRFVGVRRVKM